MPEFVRIGEAAKILGVSVATIRNMVREGTLPCKRMGNRKNYGSKSVIGERRFDVKFIYTLRGELMKDEGGN